MLFVNTQIVPYNLPIKDNTTRLARKTRLSSSRFSMHMKKPHEPKSHAFQRPLAVPVSTVFLSWKQVLAANAILRLIAIIAREHAYPNPYMLYSDYSTRELPALSSM